MSKSTEELIREALEKATPGPWSKEGCELWHRGESYGGNSPHTYIGDLKMMHEVNTHLIANAPTWLKYLLEENERLKIALHTRNSYEKTVTEMQEDIEQLNVENAAIREALEWYADESNYETHIVDEQWEPVCPIAKDEGQLARDTLLDLEGDTQ